MSKMHESASIAIVGAGSIGTGWAVVFAMAGHAVRLFDPSGARVGVAPEEIAARVEDLRACGLCPEPSAQVLKRISASPDLASAVHGAAHVQECAPEDLELKRRLFAEL